MVQVDLGFRVTQGGVAVNRATRLLAALIATGLIAVASGRATFAAFTVDDANPANDHTPRERS